MDIRKAAHDISEYVIGLRRHFHMYPESSLNEFETSKKIRQELDKLGIKYEVVADTGVVARIHGKAKGKTVLLRADMDALEIEEKNTHEYVSKNKGKMHACGHDGHTSMLIGAAKILNETKDSWSGTVVLCFQPAEEIAEGARIMIEKGNVLEGVDGAFGIHLWSDVPVGKVSVEAGPRMAGADFYTLTVRGSSGHASKPDQTIDPIVTASSIVMNLQPIVSREMDPIEPVVITVGTFNAGTRFNIIPDKAVLSGTVRCFSKDIWNDIDKKIERVASNTASAYRASIELDYQKKTPPTINDPDASRRARESVVKILGEEGVYLMERTTGAEDFAYYADSVPSCFAFVGIRNDAKEANFPHHHERFQMDEDALEIGTALYAQYALDFLAEK